MAASGTVRRLAAILAVDLVGYSRLMERDEGGTLARLKAARHHVIDPLLLAHHGRVVKLMGDGALYEFQSASDAIACAIAIQQEMAVRESALPENERLRFRIGANLGDVIIDGDDIYGEGVNVAARLEALAAPGGICVSGKIHEEVRRHVDLIFVPMGRRQVKNIAEPVDVWRVDLGGHTPPWRYALKTTPRLRMLVAACVAVLFAFGAAAWWGSWQGSPRPADTSVYGEGASLVILPFDNLTGEAGHGRVADGVVSDVIASLSSMRLISVVGRSTSFTYQASERDPLEIARELGVQFVADGVFQGDARHVWATVQLVDVESGAQLWSGRYESAADDLSTAQVELSEPIAAAVFDEVRDAAREIAHRKAENELRAFELVLLANEHRWKWTPDGNAKALELANRALALEPRSAVALTELARVYEQQVIAGFVGPADDVMARWHEAAQSAVYADANYPFGRAALASYHLNARSWDVAADQIDRALAIGPAVPELLALAAELLPYLGQTERAAELIERATRLDPVSDYADIEAQVYFFTGRYREALAVFEGYSNPSRWSQLYATLSHAQLGNAAALDRWRGRFLQSWPDYDFRDSYEIYFAPEAKAERAIWLESHRKAGLLCPVHQATDLALNARCRVGDVVVLDRSNRLDGP